MPFTVNEARLFGGLCLLDVASCASLFFATAALADDDVTFWKYQQPDYYDIHHALEDVLFLALLRVVLLVFIYLGEDPMRQRRYAIPSLCVAYIAFRVLTLVGSIFLAVKLAFFAYRDLGDPAAMSAGTTMILSLVALWLEAVIPYVLTAARLDDDAWQTLPDRIPIENKGWDNLEEKGAPRKPVAP